MHSVTLNCVKGWISYSSSLSDGCMFWSIYRSSNIDSSLLHKAEDFRKSCMLVRGLTCPPPRAGCQLHCGGVWRSDSGLFTAEQTTGWGLSIKQAGGLGVGVWVTRRNTANTVTELLLFISCLCQSVCADSIKVLFILWGICRCLHTCAGPSVYCGCQLLDQHLVYFVEMAAAQGNSQ